MFSLLNPPKYNIVFENNRNKKSFHKIKDDKLNIFHKKDKTPQKVHEKLLKNKALNDTKNKKNFKIRKNMKAPGMIIS